MPKCTSPFKYRGHHKGQDKFDKDYVDYKHKEVVKKIGEGEDDYVISIKHIEVRTPISEVVNRDAGTTGIHAVMQRVALTGDESLYPEPLPKTGVTNDYTNAPNNLLDAENYAKRMEAAFNELPENLRKGRNFNDFCNSFTQEELTTYLAALSKVINPDEKKSHVKEGDK